MLSADPRLNPQRSTSDVSHPSEVVRAIGVGAIAGGVYVATMFPGLAAIGDTPKFQFVGPVLGTPHSPGYPVYMVLSWLFAHLPLGTIVYRVNLMSAVFGAIAVALLYGVNRQLGCRRLVAAAGALAIGFGRVFWSQALLAEVYTLNAALFAGALLYLIAWSQSRRDATLIGAVAFVAVGAAHHLTLVMTIPALTVYALTVDHRRALSRRVVVATICFAAASLSAYAYIWLRTRQGAPFLEVQAHSVGELAAIVRADAFDQFLGQLSLGTIARERVPLVVGWLFGELRVPGVLLIVSGLVVLVRRRRREGALLGLVTLAIVAFALDYVVYDVEVFLLLPMIALGLVAAVGLEAVASKMSERMRPAALAYAATAILSGVVVWAQFHANRTVNDQHRHVYENALMDALFKALPDRSAIVRESYPIDHMLFYKLLAEHAAGDRQIVLIPPAASAVAQYLADGYHVFAFYDHRHDLEARGVEFVDARLGLPTARSLVHTLDTECLTMGYPVGEVIGITGIDDEAVSPIRFNPAVAVRR